MTSSWSHKIVLDVIYHFEWRNVAAVISRSHKSRFSLLAVSCSKMFWPFLYRSPMDSLKGPVIWSLVFLFWQPEQSVEQPVANSLRQHNAHIDGLVQERRNSIANALELRLFCTKPLIWHFDINSWSRATSRLIWSFILNEVIWFEKTHYEASTHPAWDVFCVLRLGLQWRLTNFRRI